MKHATTLRGLYAIADTSYLDESHLDSAVRQAIAGGARVLQYRDKSQDHERRHHQAHTLAALCRAHDVIFIVNDDIELAALVRADGVHVGRDDTDLKATRARLPTEAIVGVSCYNEFARAERACVNGADYIAFGSFFPSRTKPDAVVADAALLRKAKQILSVPIVAIGGITPENGAGLVAAGADALAVISGVFDQPDITAAARRYAALFPSATATTQREHSP